MTQQPLGGIGTPDLTLMPHQEEGIAWFKDRDQALLGDEAGLGKSAQMLRAATEPVLIVAPAMVLESGTWDDEIQKWAPGIEATQVSYSSVAQRGPRGKVPRDANGFPTTPPKSEYSDVLRHGGTLILDEAHYVKGRKTNWSVACEDLAKLADRVEMGTGTPIPNWANEAYMLLRMLYPSEARPGHTLGSYWRWCREWFVVNPSQWNPKALDVGGLQPGIQWDEFREANWGDKFLMRLREQVLKDLPPLTWTGHKGDYDLHEMFHVKMTREQQRVYNQLRRDFIAWLDTGAQVTAWTVPSQLVKLAKAATGLEVLDPSAKGSGKLDALRALLSDRPRPTLVVAHFRDSVDACARAAREATGKPVAVVRGGIPSSQRQDAIRGFQQGRYHTLCASIETVSEGMTLHQGGADHIIKVERSWRPSRNEQVDRRLHRIGVEVPVTGIDMLTTGTIDEHQQEMLMYKTDEQMGALGIDELRAMVR